MCRAQQNVKESGFSLVEMAIVVTIMGVLAGGMLAVSSNKIEKTALRTTAQKINDVDEAIKAYYSRYGFIPCPASPTAQEGTASFGFATDCTATVIAPSGTWEAGSGSDTIRGGVVPTRTLGLPDSAMYDEWGNRLSYVAIKAMTLTRTGYTTFTTSLTTGVIQMVDMNGNQLLDPSTKNIIPYVIISHGKDKKGAFGRKIVGATPQVACGTVAKDSENCDFGDPNSNDAVFMDTSISDAQTASDYFYDIVRWSATKALERNAHGVAKIKDFVVSPATDGATGGNVVANSCLIKADDTLWCWGENVNGAVGDGTTNDALKPVPVSGGGRWKKIAISSGLVYHNCAIKMDNTLWCWGYNASGELGNASAATSLIPVQVRGGGAWKEVYVIGRSTCAIKLDDTLWCWGSNIYGQLGDGTTSPRLIPTQVAVGSTWKSIAFTEYVVCGIRNDSTLWCWGTAQKSLGNGSAYSRLPVQISGAWVQVLQGSFSGCGIKTDFTLWCWGDNTYGSIGDGTYTNRTTPVQVSGGGTWKKLQEYTDSGDAMCAIKSDDTLWCWGRNDLYSSGTGSLAPKINVPTQVSGGGSWSSIQASKFSMSFNSMCGIKNDATLWCWGMGRPVPTLRTDVLYAKQINSAAVNYCVKMKDDTIWCRGNGTSGAIGDGTLTTRANYTMVEIR